MAKKLVVIGCIVRNGVKIKREELSLEEQRRMAAVWTGAAMKAAGYVPIQKSK